MDCPGAQGHHKGPHEGAEGEGTTETLWSPQGWGTWRGPQGLGDAAGRPSEPLRSQPGCTLTSGARSSRPRQPSLLCLEPWAAVPAAGGRRAVDASSPVPLSPRGPPACALGPSSLNTTLPGCPHALGCAPQVPHLPWACSGGHRGRARGSVETAQRSPWGRCPLLVQLTALRVPLGLVPAAGGALHCASSAACAQPLRAVAGVLRSTLLGPDPQACSYPCPALCCPGSPGPTPWRQGAVSLLSRHMAIKRQRPGVEEGAAGASGSLGDGGRWASPFPPPHLRGSLHPEPVEGHAPGPCAQHQQAQRLLCTRERAPTMSPGSGRPLPAMVVD